MFLLHPRDGIYDRVIRENCSIVFFFYGLLGFCQISLELSERFNDGETTHLLLSAAKLRGSSLLVIIQFVDLYLSDRPI